MYLKRLKELRLKHNLKQQDLADILKIDRTTYTSFEIGRETMSIHNLNNFVNYFKTSFDYIFELSDQEINLEIKPEIDINKVAIRLKAIRKNKGYTQAYVAKFLNTDQSVLARYEHAIFLIKTPFLYAFSKKFNISMDYILGKSEEEKLVVKNKVNS